MPAPAEVIEVADELDIVEVFKLGFWLVKVSKDVTRTRTTVAHASSSYLMIRASNKIGFVPFVDKYCKYRRSGCVEECDGEDEKT